MKVKTLRRHQNAYGDVYDKRPGREYDHPEPGQLIADGVVEAVDESKRKSKRRSTARSTSRKAGAGAGEPASS